jgi:sugar/nucleoside kinase (ribokinase family)
MSVLVVGSVAFDTIETASERRERIIGGSANFACAASSHFSPSLMVGIVGSDYPEEWLETLRSHGVDTGGVERAEGKSFFWAGRYSADFASRETLDTRLGVFEHFDPTLPESFRAPRIAFLGNIAPALQRRVLGALEPGTLVAMDTMNLWLDTVPDEVFDLVGKVHILLVNDEEALQMTGSSHPMAAARKLSDRGPATVVVKMGAHGAMVLHEGQPFFCPCYPVESVVDPTGAGDSFAGAFLGSLAVEREIDQRAVHRAIVYGSALSSWTVEHFEPRPVLEMERRELLRRFVFIRGLLDY